MVRVLIRAMAVALVCAGLGCVQPQSENRGAQTPHGRAVPPEQAVHMQTDGPTQPRQSASRPPRKEDPRKGTDQDPARRVPIGSSSGND
jgi:hypothetical protein